MDLSLTPSLKGWSAELVHERLIAVRPEELYTWGTGRGWVGKTILAGLQTSGKQRLWQVLACSHGSGQEGEG